MTEALAHGTRNFKVSEFACKCGRFDCPHYGIKQELIDALQKLRRPDRRGYIRQFRLQMPVLEQT